MSNYFLVLLAVAVRLWPGGRFWPPAPMVKAEAELGCWGADAAVAVAKLSREESHSLQAATTLSTSSAEPPTLREHLEEEYRKATKVTLVLVEKEAMSSPSSSKMKVVGTAVWLVRSSTCSVHLIIMAI